MSACLDALLADCRCEEQDREPEPDYCALLTEEQMDAMDETHTSPDYWIREQQYQRGVQEARMRNGTVLPPPSEFGRLDSRFGHLYPEEA